jgi:hypothetical protein
MLRKNSRKLALAALVAVALLDIQLYAFRFHPVTEMLGHYLRQHVVPNGPAEPLSGSEIRSPMEAPLQKV